MRIIRRNLICPYASLGAVAGICTKILSEHELPENIKYWIVKTHDACREYLLKLPKPTDAEIQAIKPIMDKFFTEHFKKDKHILSMVNFFICIIDDLRIRDSGMTKIGKALNGLHTSVVERYKDKALCLNFGIKTGEKWHEAFGRQ